MDSYEMAKAAGCFGVSDELAALREENARLAALVQQYHPAYLGLPHVVRERNEARAEIAKIRAADKLAPMLDFVEIADSRTREVDRLQGILNRMTEALHPAYGDDVHRCTQETLPEWVSAQVAKVARLEGLLLSVARVIRGRDGLPCWCDDYDARPDHTHSAKCIEARRNRALREEKP